MRRYKLLFLVLLLVSIEGIAKDKWTRVVSQNFIVIGNGSEANLKQTALRLESFREVIGAVLVGSKVVSPVSSTVIVFESNSSFSPFKPKYKGKIRDNVAGYFISGVDTNYIALTTDVKGVNPYEVIFHEYEHFIVHNNLPNLPLWLNEGMAEFYSTFSLSSDGKKARLGMPMDRHLFLLRREKLFPLKTLFAINHRSPEYSEANKVGVFYSQSWALTHFLSIGNNMEREAQLSEFIKRLNTGITVEENFKASFQVDYVKIEKELNSYVGKSTFPAIEYSLSDEVTLDKNLKSEILSDTESQFYLGDLLAHQSRWDESDVYLQKSLQSNPKYNPTLLALGFAKMSQQEPTEADKLFRQVLTREPQNYLVYLYHGQALTMEGKFEDAVQSLRTAISLKPDLAANYASFGIALTALGNESEAAAAFAQAEKLDLKNISSYRSRSMEFLNMALGEKAAIAAKLFLSTGGWKESSSPYMALAAYLGYRQMKMINEADEMLKEFNEKGDTVNWPNPVMRYFRHELNAEELVKRAKDNGELTEAHGYIGMGLSLQAKREEALIHLYWVRDKGIKSYTEYEMSLAEIKRLEKVAK
jgi:tetratricopeptide (TPR) repeat protein